MLQKQIEVIMYETKWNKWNISYWKMGDSWLYVANQGKAKFKDGQVDGGLTRAKAFWVITERLGG